MNKFRIERWLSLYIALLLAFLAIGCGEDSSDAPIIFSVTPEPGLVAPGEVSTVTVEAGDSDSDELFYEWTASVGSLTGNGKTVSWQSPESEGKYELIVTVSDGENSVSESTTVRVSRNYYPLAVGNKWTYKDSNDGIIDFEIVDIITIEELDAESFVKQTTTLVENEETSELEEAANFTYIGKTADGISQYGMGGYNAGGDTVTFSPELPIYRFPPIDKESWQVDFDVKLEFAYFVGNGTAEYEVILEDELTVEAGTFQHVFRIKEDFTWQFDGQPIDHIVTYHWLAADVGIIKFSQEETIGGQLIITEAELQSYSLE